MASWLPETLFEIVGQGPAPSKDYYQLLITQSQASANHGFLSLLTPSPPARASRCGPLQANSHRGLPEAPRLGYHREIAPRHLCSAARESVFSPRPARPRRAFLASPQCRPLPFLPPGCLPAAFPPRAGEKQASLLACRLTSEWEGGEERLSQVSQGGARRGRKGRSLPGQDLILGGFRTSRWP